jgi:Flp pilus assembly pilin Flp
MNPFRTASSRRGQDIVEYALLLAFVGLLVIGALVKLSQVGSQAMTGVSQAANSGGEPPGPGGSGQTWTLTVQSSGAPNVAISGTHGNTTNYAATVSDGTAVTLTAPATTTSGGLGCDFSKWQWDGADQPAGQQTLTFSMTADTTVVAFYTEAYWTLAIQTPDGSGTTNPATGSASYQVGTTVGVTAAASSGWTFDHWVLDGTTNDTSNPITVAGGVSGQTKTLKAVFVSQNWTLTVQAPTGSGTTNPGTGSTDYTVGTSAQVTATPATGWLLSYWLLDGANAGSANPITVASGTGGQTKTLKAVFVQGTYTLTVQSSGVNNVAITGTPSGTTDYTNTVLGGTTVTLTAPATKTQGSNTYSFVKWQRDGVDQPAGQQTLTFTMPANTTAVAVYVKN